MNYRIAGLICFIAFGLQVYLLNEYAAFMFYSSLSGKTVILSFVIILMFIYGYLKMIRVFRKKEFPSRLSALLFLGLTSIMGVFIVLAQGAIWVEAINPQMR